MDTVGAASGIVSLAVFALQTASSLVNLIRNIKEAPRAIRDTRTELESLTDVLDALRSAADNAKNDEYSTLQVPLRRCGQTCQDFTVILGRVSGGQGDDRRLVTDWWKVRYLGSDINGFKDSIASYRGSIAVALASINLRTVAVSREAFEGYKQLVEDTAVDLKARLATVDDSLQRLLSRDSDSSETKEDPAVHRQILEERRGIEKCLEICDTVSGHMSSLKQNLSNAMPNTGGGDDRPVIASFTTAADQLNNYKAQLESCVQNLIDRLDRTSVGASRPPSTGRDTERQQLREELKGLQQGISVCENAAREAQLPRTNIFEDVSLADDGLQAIVSTTNDLIFARKVKAGARSSQALGQTSNATIQQIIIHHGSNSPDQTSDSAEASADEFQGRHGTGRSLVSASSRSQRPSR